MDTNLLLSVLRKDSIVQKMFGGVVPCDMLPRAKVTVPTLYIVNKDKSTLPGSHWTAIFIDPKQDSGVYFDSYGLKPHNKYITRFFNYNCNVVEYNTERLQGLCSDVCGAYCVYFCYLISRGFTMNDLVKKFRQKSDSYNDKWVVKFLKVKYHHSFKQIRTDAQCYNQTSHALST